MTVCTFSAGRLHGVAAVPPAKSEAHRALLLAALGCGTVRMSGFPRPLCDDTQAMLNGIAALGATVQHEDDALLISPASSAETVEPPVCDVHACAAALRMLIPAFLVRGRAVRFVMDDALYKRPLTAFDPLIASLGATMRRVPSANGQPAYVELNGRMPAGRYEIDGSLSSQFASGMLIALSFATDADGRRAPSTLCIRPPIVSRPYLDMTLQMMARYGLNVEEHGGGRFELTPCDCRNPAEAAVTGDWSQAAVLLCANAMGSGVILAGMHAPQENETSLQGDSRIVEILHAMGLTARSTHGDLLLRSPSRAGLMPLTLNCDNIPDIAPILALTCTQARGTSVLSGVKRLRVKECDRLDATCELLGQMGAALTLSDDDDTLTIHGPTKLHGGFEADARNDHRIVMFLATAALLCDEPITVSGVEALNKSWPAFLDVYRSLGGSVR